MGSGKSTIANLLHARTGIRNIDLDHYIEEKQGLKIPEIFELKGEVRFRKLEHIALKEILEIDDSFILGLGGGTPCFANNISLLEAEGMITIYLKASIETLYNRLANFSSERPLLQDKSPDELKEFIAKHLFERNPYYSRALYKVNTDNKTPQEVVEDILQFLA